MLQRHVRFNYIWIICIITKQQKKFKGERDCMTQWDGTYTHRWRCVVSILQRLVTLDLSGSRWMITRDDYNSPLIPFHSIIEKIGFGVHCGFLLWALSVSVIKRVVPSQFTMRQFSFSNFQVVNYVDETLLSLG